jgi:hypothetical protein
MPNKVEIANIALNLIGSQSITSFIEDTQGARLVNSIWEVTVNALLQEHPWNFSIKRAELAQSATTPAFEYAYSYILPVDCLRVLSTYPSRVKYDIESNLILCDEPTLSIRYISKVENEELFPNLFVESLIFKLAYELAYPIASNATLQANLFDLYKKKSAIARSMNAQESGKKSLDTAGNTWDSARA